MSISDFYSSDVSVEDHPNTSYTTVERNRSLIFDRTEKDSPVRWELESRDDREAYHREPIAFFPKKCRLSRVISRNNKTRPMSVSSELGRYVHHWWSDITSPEGKSIVVSEWGLTQVIIPIWLAEYVNHDRSLLRASQDYRWFNLPKQDRTWGNRSSCIKQRITVLIFCQARLFSVRFSSADILSTPLLLWSRRWLWSN